MRGTFNFLLLLLSVTALYAQTSIGTVSFIIGESEYSVEGNSEWMTLKLSDNVRSNWIIQTGEDAELEITWWQPHGAVEHYGYWRLALVDPLWAAGTFRGPAGRIERKLSFAPGVAYVSSTPEASGEGEDWERHDRAYSKKDFSPDPEAKLSLRYRLTAGARSPCSGAKPWEAFDGDSDTAWKPSGCPAGDAYASRAGRGDRDPGLAGRRFGPGLCGRG